MSDPIAWARAWPAAKSFARRLRSGAWYPVVGSEPDGRVALLVNGERVHIPGRLLEVRDRPPTRFSVVSRQPDAPNPVRGTPADLGPVYAVCPQCAGRMALYGAPPSATCRSCGHRGEVAWWET